MSLPRILWLASNGSLGMTYAPETDALAIRRQDFDPAALDNGALPVYSPRSVKIHLSAMPEAGARTGLIIKQGSAVSMIYYDQGAGRLVFDASHPAGNARPFLEAAPFSLSSGETLDMTVFMDRSVVEIFVNKRQAITRRLYFAEEFMPEWTLMDGSSIQSVSAWEMMPSQPY